MRSIKNITLGLATVGVMSLSGCAGDYLDTIPSTSVSEPTINTSLDNLYIALNGIHKEMVSQEKLEVALSFPTPTMPTVAEGRQLGVSS